MGDEAPDGNRYPIGTLEQMAAIPLEARGRFLAELPSMLDEMAKAVEMYAEMNIVFDGIGRVEMQTPEWIDDDKNSVTHSLQTADGCRASITLPRTETAA